MKHWGKTLFGVAVTVFLLWWVLRNEDPSEIWANILQGDFVLLFASVAVATFGFFIRRRPLHSVLDCGRIARVHRIALRPWQPALVETVSALLAQSTAEDS